MAEFYRFANWNRAQGVIPDPAKWLVVLAATLSSAPPGPIVLSPKSDWYGKWRGLDIESLAWAAKQCHLEVSQQQLDERLASTLAWRQGVKHSRPISAKKAGQMLGVTAIARLECRMWHIEAINETRLDRAERKRMLDRIYHEKKRREQGAKPRKEWTMTHEAEKPWLAEGISRRTWYNHRAKAALGPSAAQLIPYSQSADAQVQHEPKELARPEWQPPLIEEIWNGGGKVFNLPHDRNGEIIPDSDAHREAPAFYALRNREVTA